MTNISQKALAARYLLALSMVAVLTISSHMILVTVLQRGASSAAIINTSGRQRMLSQRIASLAVQYNVLEDRGTKADLLAAADEMDRNLADLSVDNQTMPTLKTDPVMRALYFTGPAALSVTLPAYTKLARAIVAAPPGDKTQAPSLAILLAQARAPLLAQLNAVTTEWVRHDDFEMHRLYDLQAMVLFFVLVTLAFEAGGIFGPMLHRLKNFTSELVRLTVVDPLTDMHNRRGFLWRAEIELKRVARYGQPLSLLVATVDQFKDINSQHGHPGGDVVLQTLGRSFLQSFRTSDILGRWGSDEFVVLLPVTSAGAAAMLAERIRGKVANLPIHLGDIAVPVTISIGVVEVEQGAVNLDEAKRRANSALYIAKNRGSNRVELAPTAERVRVATVDAAW